MIDGSAKKVVPATVNFRSSCLYSCAICNRPAVIDHQHHVGLRIGEFQQRGTEIGLAELRGSCARIVPPASGKYFR